MGLLRQYLKIRGQWQIGDRWNCADSAASWLQIENSSWKSGGFWWHQCRLLRRRNKKNCSRIFLQTSEKCTVMLSDEWTIRVYKRKGMIFISQVWTTSNIQYSNCHTDHNLLWGKEGGDWGGPASGTMSKKIIGKNLSEVSLNENLPEKLKSMGVEDAFRARSARKRHSIQLDKRISIQLQERRSSNASSTSETADSVCKCNSTQL